MMIFIMDDDDDDDDYDDDDDDDDEDSKQEDRQPGNLLISKGWRRMSMVMRMRMKGIERQL